MTFEIQKVREVPKIARAAPPPRKRMYPFEDMEPGDFFFVPGKTKNMLSTHASEVGKRMGAKFQTRLAWMSKVSGQWEPCAEGDEGAEKGIFVTRSE